MTTVVFVHGTGVRQPRYAALFAMVSARLAALRSDVAVVPCLWGDQLGATLPDKPTSIPDYTGTGGGVRKPVDTARRAQERWALLDIDPLHELRCLAVIFERDREPGWKPASTAARLGKAVPALIGHESLVVPLAEASLAGVFATAVDNVWHSAEAQDAATRCTGGGDEVELREALAQAFVAEALRLAGAEFGGPVAIGGPRRAALIRAVGGPPDAAQASRRGPPHGR